VWHEPVGDAVAGIDAEDEWRLADISVQGEKRWWEQDAPNYVVSWRGGDFFFEVTLADASVKRVVVGEGSFRSIGPTNYLPELVADGADHQTSASSFKMWGAALESDGKALASVCLLYAPWVHRGLHAREPQLVTCWEPAGPHDAYHVEVRPPAERIPSAAMREKALHPYHFEYNVVIRASGGPCAVSQTYLLLHAVERAVWRAITWTAENANAIDTAATRVPPSTSVTTRCVCNGAGCDAGCEHSFAYPPQYPHVAASDVVRPAVDAALPVPPQCGCDFSYAGFDYSAGTCGSGYAHVDSLTRVQHSETVSYYENGAGDKMWHGINFGDQKQGLHGSLSLDEAIAACSADAVCRVLVYERPDKYWFAPGACMAPCFKKDYWGRVAYHLDNWINPFQLDAASLDIQPVMTFRLAFSSPDAAFAAAAHTALAAGVDPHANVSGSSARAVLQSLSNDPDFLAAVPGPSPGGIFGGSFDGADLSADVASGGVVTAAPPPSFPQPPAAPHPLAPPPLPSAPQPQAPSPPSEPAPPSSPPFSPPPPPFAPNQGMLSYPGRVVIPSSSRDARELYLSSAFMGGSAVSPPVPAALLAASDPAPSSALKRWYLAVLEGDNLNVVVVDVAYSQGQLAVSSSAALRKSGFLAYGSPQTIGEVDVLAEIASGTVLDMGASKLARSQSSPRYYGYGVSSLTYVVADLSPPLPPAPPIAPRPPSSPPLPPATPWSSGFVGSGVCCSAGRTDCGRADFSVDTLAAAYPSLDTAYQTSTSHSSTNGWYLGGSVGVGMCNIRSVENCGAICAAVAGCTHFATSLTYPCYACFIYSSCPDTSGWTQYQSYSLSWPPPSPPLLPSPPSLPSPPFMPPAPPTLPPPPPSSPPSQPPPLSPYGCHNVPQYAGDCPNYYGCYGAGHHHWNNADDPRPCDCLGYCGVDPRCCLAPPSQPPSPPLSPPSSPAPPGAPPTPPPPSPPPPAPPPPSPTEGVLLLARFAFDTDLLDTNADEVDTDSSSPHPWTTSDLMDKATGTGAAGQSNRHSFNRKFYDSTLRLSSNREGDEQTPIASGGSNESTWLQFTITPAAGESINYALDGTATVETGAHNDGWSNTRTSYSMYWSDSASGPWTLLPGGGEGANIDNSGVNSGPITLSWDLQSIGDANGAVHFILDPMSTGATNGVVHNQRGISIDNVQVFLNLTAT